jgi:hypothetical protein
VIAGEGGNISSLATYRGRRSDCVAVTLRVERVEGDRLRELVEAAGVEVLYVWQLKPERARAEATAAAARPGRAGRVRRSP